jgi:hypothetical protein
MNDAKALSERLSDDTRNQYGRELDRTEAAKMIYAQREEIERLRKRNEELETLLRELDDALIIGLGDREMLEWRAKVRAALREEGK